MTLDVVASLGEVQGLGSDVVAVTDFGSFAMAVEAAGLVVFAAGAVVAGAMETAVAGWAVDANVVFGIGMGARPDAAASSICTGSSPLPALRRAGIWCVS